MVFQVLTSLIFYWAKDSLKRTINITQVITRSSWYRYMVYVMLSFCLFKCFSINIFIKTLNFAGILTRVVEDH